MTGLQAQKRPLMLAALNGLSVARVSGREDGRHDATRVPIDERVSSGLVRCGLFSVLPDSRSSPCLDLSVPLASWVNSFN